MKNILKSMQNKLYLVFLIIIFLIIEVYCDLTLPSYTAQIVNKGIQYSNFNIIVDTGTNMMIMVVISVLATIVVAYLSSKVSSLFARDIREEMFQKIL